MGAPRHQTAPRHRAADHRHKNKVRRRPGSPATAAGVALLVVGITAALVIGNHRRPPGRVLGGNLPVNPSAADKSDASAHNSPALHANPTNPANLAEAERVDSPQPSCAVRVSADGGSQWSAVPITLPPSESVSCFSPDLAFGADGTLYVAFTTFGPVSGQGVAPDGLWLVTSHNAGRSFSPPVRAEGTLTFQAHLAADPTVPGLLWLTWLQASDTSSFGLASTGDPIVVARSEDGGTTWGRPVKASGGGRARVVAPSLAVGRGSALELAYLDVGDDRLDYSGAAQGRGGEPYAGRWSLVVARSIDQGSTWAETVLDSAVVPTRRFLMLYPPGPAVAIDSRRGRSYVAFHDARLGDADVRLWRSTDGGRRWGTGQRVNDTRPHDGTSQYLPALGVAADGRVDVVYYDRRADRRDVTTGVSLQSSFDGGASFTASLRVSERAFDSGIGVGSDQGMAELGDRLGIVSTDSATLAMWTDTRAGTRTTGKQDLARAIVVIKRPSRLRPVLRGAAGAVALLGLALVLRSLVTRRRQPVAATGTP